MTLRHVQFARIFLALILAGLIASCVNPEFEGMSVSGDNSGRVAPPYVYNAVGSLEYEDPVQKATKVMLAACPQGQPILMKADVAQIRIENSNRNLLIALFTCNQIIAEAE